MVAAIQEEYEMQPIYNTRRSRTAISGQTALQPLQLGDSAPNVANTSTPPRRTRLTDVEMIEAEAGWGSAERASGCGGSHHLRHLSNPARFSRIERNQNRLSRPHDFGIAQQDGTTAIIQDGRLGLLMSVEEGRNLRSRVEQKKLSRPYFWASAITPVTAIAFGLGIFDRVMVERSGGRFQQMERDDKSQALYLLAPISIMIWVIIIVLVFLAVVAAKGGL